MEKIKLNDLNILDVGNTIQIAGLIMSDGQKDYLCYLPDDKRSDNLVALEMDIPDWEKFFKQTDVLETEVLAQAANGTLTKIVLRKSQRQVDAGISWRVFQRDGYTCRYCGITGVPMTVDHLVLWEAGGPTTVENLVTACRKCNKLRGCTEYAAWLTSKDYLERSKNLPEKIKAANLDLVNKLYNIPLKHHIQKR